MRHPLQTGATMLRRVLFATLVLAAVAAVYGWVVRPTDPGELPRAGIVAFEWLLFCPLTTVALVALIGRTRASDCEFGPTGFRVLGGAFDKLVVAWRDLRMGGTSLYNGRLVLDLGDGVTIPVASARVPSEQTSLQALLETFAFRKRYAATGVGELGQPTLEPSVHHCPNCGAPAVVDDAPQVACRACGHSVEVPEPLRVKIRASRALGTEQNAVAVLVRKALDQPSAKRINQWLIALAVLGIVWLPAPVMLLSGTATAVSVVLFFLLYWYTYSLIANRRALAVLIADCGAHRVNDTYCCCACGAPLPVAQEANIVCQCVYCDTDNVLGFDVVRERSNTENARATLADAYTAHRLAIRRARIGATGASMLTLAVYGVICLVQLADEGDANSSTSAGTTCYASTCTFVGFDRRSEKVLSNLSGGEVTLTVAPNARMNELHLVGSSVRVTELNVVQPVEPFNPSDLLAFRSLVRLRIERTSLPSVAQLRGLPLKTLDLIQIPNELDFGAIGTLSDLSRLSLKGTTFRDLKTLNRLTRLSELDLSDTPIANLNGIDALRGLRNFYCYRCKSLFDLSPLIGHPTLESLSLSGGSQRTLDALPGLPNLRVLRVGENQVSDFFPLKRLTNLRVLEVDGNPASSIEPLYGLSSLQELRIDTSKLEHLDALFQLKSLNKLCVQPSISSSDEEALRRALPNTKLVKFPCISISDVVGGI